MQLAWQAVATLAPSLLICSSALHGARLPACAAAVPSTSNRLPPHLRHSGALHLQPPASPPASRPHVQVRAPRVEALSSVEASLRLDAVASAGFRMSRSKMTDLVKSGEGVVQGTNDRPDLVELRTSRSETTGMVKSGEGACVASGVGV